MNGNYNRIYAEINLDHIANNIARIKSCIGAQTQIMAVIKADGYGHGAIPIARELENETAVYGFGVATAEEALLLRKAGIQKPVLVVGYTFPDSYEALIRERIAITLFRRDMVKALTDVVDRLQRQTGSDIKANVHIKVDTGMNRLGITPDKEGIRFIEAVLREEKIQIEGAFTHFAKADAEDLGHARMQYESFKSFLDQIQSQLHYRIPLRHCDNSAGALRFGQEKGMDIVRTGIAIYGLSPVADARLLPVPLYPALALYSKVIYVKTVAAGAAVSYGGIYTTDKETRIATIPVGYGDGYPRALSNQGYVLIRGQRANILGRICMDQFMVDVTDIAGVTEGDDVTLVGSDKEASITVEELSRISGRFNYEFVCGLGKRIPRVYVKAGRVIATKDYFNDF